MNNKTNYLKFLGYFLVLLFPLAQVAHAQFDTPISAEDQENFDQILSPVTKIYNFIKYAASVVAGIALLFGGISYMFSGNDVAKREKSKHTIAYVLIGLCVIWGAPYGVSML